MEGGVHTFFGCICGRHSVSEVASVGSWWWMSNCSDGGGSLTEAGSRIKGWCGGFHELAEKWTWEGVCTFFFECVRGRHSVLEVASIRLRWRMLNQGGGVGNKWDGWGIRQQSGETRKGGRVPDFHTVHGSERGGSAHG